MRILLVDNKGICIDTLLAAVGGAASTVEVCSTFDEAQEKLKQFKPDIAILSRDLLSPTKQNILQNINLVIFANDEFLEKAGEWAASGKDIAERVKGKSEERRKIFDRIQGITERMEQRKHVFEELLMEFKSESGVLSKSGQTS